MDEYVPTTDLLWANLDATLGTWAYDDRDGEFTIWFEPLIDAILASSWLAAHDREVGRVAAEKALREEAAILHAGDKVWAHKAAEHLIARISHRTLDEQETTT